MRTLLLILLPQNWPHVRDPTLLQCGSDWFSFIDVMAQQSSNDRLANTKLLIDLYQIAASKFQTFVWGYEASKKIQSTNKCLCNFRWFRSQQTGTHHDVQKSRVLLEKLLLQVPSTNYDIEIQAFNVIKGISITTCCLRAELLRWLCVGFVLVRQPDNCVRQS